MPPVLWTLCTTGLEILVPKGEMLPPTHNNDFIPLEVKTATRPLWALHAFEQWAKKGGTAQAVVTDPDCQWEIGLLTRSGGKKEYFWNTGDPLGSWY